MWDRPFYWLTSGGTPYYSKKSHYCAPNMIENKCSYDFLWSTDVGCCEMCLDFFLCSIFLFWYFDITFLTILWRTISIHISAESNFFDTYKNNRFWSPILILLVFQSYHSPHPISIPTLVQFLSCFWHVFTPTLSLFLPRIHLNLYPTSISIPIIILLVSWFHSRPNLISILAPLWFCTTKASF